MSATPNRRRALILGAGSQITPFLSQRLGDLGYGGHCVSRTPPPGCPPIHPAFSWQRVDLTLAPDWSAMPEAVAFSVLPLWLLPRHIPALAAVGIRQVVAFSSTSVFSKATSADPAERDVASRLADAEAAVAAACDEAGIPWTILRPTLIYGSGRDKNVAAVAGFIRRFGFFPVAHPARGLRQPVHADDLAGAAVAAIGNPGAYSRAFDLPGGETLTYRRMVERIFARLGRPPRILRLPTWLLRGAMPVAQRWLPGRYSPALFLRMNQNLAFDGEPAREALGYAPRPFRPEFSPEVVNENAARAGRSSAAAAQRESHAP